MKLTFFVMFVIFMIFHDVCDLCDLSDLTHSVVDRSACEFSLACKAGMFYDYERSPQLSESSSVTDQ